MCDVIVWWNWLLTYRIYLKPPYFRRGWFVTFPKENREVELARNIRKGSNTVFNLNTNNLFMHAKIIAGWGQKSNVILKTVSYISNQRHSLWSVIDWKLPKNLKSVTWITTKIFTQKIKTNYLLNMSKIEDCLFIFQHLKYRTGTSKRPNCSLTTIVYSD